MAAASVIVTGMRIKRDMKAIFVSVIKCFLKHAGTGFAKLQKTLGDLNKELPFLIEKVRKRNCFLTSDCRQRSV